MTDRDRFSRFLIYEDLFMTLRYGRVAAGSLWLAAQTVRPGFGFASGWNADTLAFNVGTCLVYAMILWLIRSGLKWRAI